MMMMKDCWLQIHRRTTPVLVAFSCLCLALGSCFPSSEPLNRLFGSMDHQADRTRHDVPTASQTPTYLVTNNGYLGTGKDSPSTRMLADRVLSLQHITQQQFSLKIYNSKDINRIPSEILPPTARSTDTSNSIRVEHEKSLNRRPRKSHRSSSRINRDGLEPRAGYRSSSRINREGLEPRAGSRNNKRSNRECRMYSKSHYIRLENSRHVKLAVFENGSVNGTLIEDAHAILKLIAKSLGIVRIYGVQAGMYVCMNSDGDLYGSRNNSKECLFRETMNIRSLYSSYSSVAYPANEQKRWYIGITKHGNVKRGKHVKSHMRIAQFLANRIECN